MTDNNNNQNDNSLYELIKQKSQEKGRPLKIICDWDDCIQPFWPWIVFQSSPDKDNWDKFPEYFEAYFNEDRATNQEAVEFVKKTKKEKLAGSYYDQFRETYGMSERFRAPFLSISEDLVLGLKEGLIEDLLAITSFTYEGQGSQNSDKKKIKYPSGKTFASIPLWSLITHNARSRKFWKTFGKFPNANFEVTELRKNKEGKYVPPRWERIKEACPDFDIFIDDKEDYILGACSAFPDRDFVLPDYKYSRHIQAPNIYHVKITVSDLKDEDFAKAAEEYKAQKEQERLTPRTASAERERERKSNPLNYWCEHGRY